MLCNGVQVVATSQPVSQMRVYYIAVAACTFASTENTTHRLTQQNTPHMHIVHSWGPAKDRMANGEWKENLCLCRMLRENSRKIYDIITNNLVLHHGITIISFVQRSAGCNARNSRNNRGSGTPDG